MQISFKNIAQKADSPNMFLFIQRVTNLICPCTLYVSIGLFQHFKFH